MSAIGSVGAQAVATQMTQQAQRVSDPDHDGDNDAGVSAAKEAAEGGTHGPAVKLTLSAAAQSIVAGQ